MMWMSEISGLSPQFDRVGILNSSLSSNLCHDRVAVLPHADQPLLSSLLKSHAHLPLCSSQPSLASLFSHRQPPIFPLSSRLSVPANHLFPLCSSLTDLASLFKTHSSRLSITPRPRPHAAASRLGLDLTPRPHASASTSLLGLTPRPRPHASTSRLRLDLTLRPRPHSSASTSRLGLDLTPRPRPHASLLGLSLGLTPLCSSFTGLASLFKPHASSLGLTPLPHVSASRLTPRPHASPLGLTPHASHLTFSSTPLNSQLSRLKHHKFTGKVSNFFLLVIGSVMSKNLVDAPLPSVEESITGPLLLDHEMDSTQGDPIQIDDDEEDTDEGIPDKKRKKKSQVWLEFKEIEVGDGTKKAECMHCKQRLKYAGTTSQLKRHLDNTCTRRKIALRSQRMLNVVPVAPGISKGNHYYKHLPSVEDWNRVELVCEVLEVFSVSTKMISGSEYPTSNLFLSEIYRVKEVLEKKTNDQNIFMKEMIMKMRAKFDKYWGECNLLMAFGAILDPRCKMRFIEFCFPLIYPKDEVTTNIASIRGSLYELYNEYATLLASNVDEHNEEVVSQSTGTSSGSLVSSRSLLKKNSAWSQFDQFVQRVETVQPEKSDLDVYLEEGVFRCADDPYNYFDALNWWKANSLKYRVLSLMACDILAIPITTVASESTFSAGGRVIDTYRASLSTDTVQALVCGGDWVRHKFRIKKKSRKRDNTLFEEEVVITIP
ncbi:Zinc finger BED domain-containing protein [Quillaja saponaria]|uniref:Zinc finger BED domain-containing protein n=1 Tax=Quillaja saponaria TaxID=32244 RepID=A0AAD7PQR5_QUISA|nr:Zinc finger BED domain-containing protein [Quillaja saponaria]